MVVGVPMIVVGIWHNDRRLYTNLHFSYVAHFVQTLGTENWERIQSPSGDRARPSVPPYIHMNDDKLSETKRSIMFNVWIRDVTLKKVESSHTLNSIPILAMPRAQSRKTNIKKETRSHRLPP